MKPCKFFQKSMATFFNSGKMYVSYQEKIVGSTLSFPIIAEACATKHILLG
jgi:hypothetical protein